MILWYTVESVAPSVPTKIEAAIILVFNKVSNFLNATVTF